MREEIVALAPREPGMIWMTHEGYSIHRVFGPMLDCTYNNMKCKHWAINNIEFYFE